MAFLIKYRQLCSCFPQMSLSTSFSPFQHVPQKQFRTSHGFPWSNGMAFQKTFPDSGSVSRLSTCRKELQEHDAAWSWWFFWINLIRKYEGTNATAYIWDNAMFFLLLDCWFGDVKKRWLVHQKSVTSLFISLFICKINVDVVLKYRISVTILASEVWKQAFALSIGHESERHSAGMGWASGPLRF